MKKTLIYITIYLLISTKLVFGLAFPSRVNEETFDKNIYFYVNTFYDYQEFLPLKLLSKIKHAVPAYFRLITYIEGREALKYIRLEESKNIEKKMFKDILECIAEYSSDQIDDFIEIFGALIETVEETTGNPLDIIFLVKYITKDTDICFDIKYIMFAI